jgi:hypothetical protein
VLFAVNFLSKLGFAGDHKASCRNSESKYGWFRRYV